MITYVLQFTHSGYLCGGLENLINMWKAEPTVTVEKDTASYGAWRVHFQTEPEATLAYRCVREESNILSMRLVKEEVLILE